jgi:DnaJ-class molecular chaperone
MVLAGPVANDPGRRGCTSKRRTTTTHSEARGNEIDCGASYSRRVPRREGNGSQSKGATFAPEMEGGEHSSAELTISVKVPCPECGGRGYVETVTESGHIVGDTAKECLTCSGRGLIPEDMPLSEFRELLASHFR